MDIFKEIPGLQPLSDEAKESLVAFQKAMEEEVIPEIVKTMRRRQELAIESRNWVLFCASV